MFEKKTSQYQQVPIPQYTNPLKSENKSVPLDLSQVNTSKLQNPNIQIKQKLNNQQINLLGKSDITLQELKNFQIINIFEFSDDKKKWIFKKDDQDMSLRIFLIYFVLKVIRIKNQRQQNIYDKLRIYVYNSKKLQIPQMYPKDYRFQVQNQLQLQKIVFAKIFLKIKQELLKNQENNIINLMVNLMSKYQLAFSVIFLIFRNILYFQIQKQIEFSSISQGYQRLKTQAFSIVEHKSKSVNPNKDNNKLQKNIKYQKKFTYIKIQFFDLQKIILYFNLDLIDFKNWINNNFVLHIIQSNILDNTKNLANPKLLKQQLQSQVSPFQNKNLKPKSDTFQNKQCQCKPCCLI